MSDQLESAGETTREDQKREESSNGDLTSYEYSPEGTRTGWLSVAGAFFSMFVTFGYLNSFGVYQDFYQRTFLQNYPSSTIAWIGSVQYFLIFGAGVFTGRLFDAGLFYILFDVFAILIVLFQMLLSLCTQYYQFFLCQGIGIGLCFGLLMNLTVGVPAHWFKTRRATAMGIMASGSSIGGIVFPVAVNKLSIEVGFPWAMRIIGFIILFCVVTARLLMRTRLPPNPDALRVKRLSDVLNFRFFLQMPAYTFFTLGAFLISFGIYTPFTYITMFARQHRSTIDPSLGEYLLPIINAASTFGRLGPAFLADRFGRFNTVIPCLMCTAVLVIVWPLCTTTVSVVIFAILFGFFSGVYVSLIPACVTQLCSTSIVGQVLGLMFFFLGIACALGPPISGALLQTSNPENYWAAAGFAGGITAVGTLFLVISRHIALRGKLGGII